jgi:hypothetical protein
MSARTWFAALSATVAALLAAPVQAEVVTFEFRGKVTFSTYLAPVGTPVTGTFSYDTQAVPRQPGKPQPQVPGAMHYGLPMGFEFKAQVGNHNIVSQTVTVRVVNDFGGNIEDAIDIDGEVPVIDGTTYAAGALHITLASGPGKTKVLTDTSLPLDINVHRFDAEAVGRFMIDRSGSGTQLQFDIGSIQRVRNR